MTDGARAVGAGSRGESRPVETAREREAEPLLSVRNLKKHFPVNTGFISSLRVDRSKRFPIRLDDTKVRAVDGVNFDLYPGETFGVVGESGCGKSTLARTILRLEEPTSGEIWFNGKDISELDPGELSEFRKNVQIVFQDPQSSLNPRRKIGSIIADPLEAAGWEKERRRSRVMELLDEVGLEPGFYNRYPHEFSGGQRQRINLARALSISPDVVIADELVSGLDMSIQAQILNLMDELQDEYGLTYLFITHDLSVVRQVADRITVMYLGDFVETGPKSVMFSDPHHPYSRALLDAVPNPNPDAREVTAQLGGDVPSPSNPPSGCKFHTRCPEVIPPEGFSREAYREYLDFKLAIEEARVDPASEDVADYFDTSLPAEGRDAAEDAMNLVDIGEAERAIDRLGAIQSVCVSESPRLEAVDGADTHRSACHLADDYFGEYVW